MNKKFMLTVFVVLLGLVACGRPSTPTPDAGSPEPTVGDSPVATPTSEPPTEPKETSPLSDPTPVPTTSSTGTLDQVVAAAKEHLSEDLNVEADEVEVSVIEPVQWSDASLGCPEPGKAYAQVVTPGYRIVLEVDGKEHELHTDESGQTVVICDRKLEKAPAAALRYLSNELGIPAEEIEVLSVRKYEWPDASLGCPEPGKSYAQVVTPGYGVILEAEGQRYEVHTDDEGQTVVICEPDS